MKLATALLLALSIIAAASPVNAANDTPPKITAIHAQLYYEGTGKFSDDVLAQKDLSLWNTIIGEGSADGASNYTFVTVEVQGQDMPIGAVKIRVEARNQKRKIVAVHTSTVSLYDDKTHFNAPLFLYDTGCDEIEVSAYLLGKGIKKRVVKAKIPFACGE
jgi:hypothetical protein